MGGQLGTERARAVFPLRGPASSTLSYRFPVPALSCHVMVICTRALETRCDSQSSPLALQARSSAATSLDPATLITSGTMP